MASTFDTILARPVSPWIGLAAGVVLAAGLLLTARSRRHAGLLLKFLAELALAWAVLCGVYLVAGANGFREFVASGRAATVTLAALGAAWYLVAFITFDPEEDRWRAGSMLLAGVVLMVGSFVRAAYQPEVMLYVQGPLAVLMVTTVWRFRAEPLVYLSVLGLAVAIILAGPEQLIRDPDVSSMARTATTGAAVSMAMIIAGAVMELARSPSMNVRWYRQGLLIAPLVISTLGATAAGFAAVWYEPTWHTVWALGAWWAVLLVSSLGLGQADLFGFSCIGAGLAAVAAFTVLGGPQVQGYWGRYSTVLLMMGFGASLLSALIVSGRKTPRVAAFARALYLAAVAVAVAGLAVEPVATTTKYLAIDFLVAAIALLPAHAHGAPSWVNYLVAGLVTSSVVAASYVPWSAPAPTWHHRLIQVTAGLGVGWLAVSLALRRMLRTAAADRTARRVTEPFTVFGLCGIVGLAAYLLVLQVRAYAEWMIDGVSPTLPLLGPWWGLVGWIGVLVGFLLSIWLVRHTARTFLFYCFGIAATVYLGLFQQSDAPGRTLYHFLIYAIGGYGAAHLLVYLYEAKFMALLARTCGFYRDERRASTTIFTLAVTSCFAGAVLAAFEMDAQASLIMLGLMTIVFLIWSFVWLRGEMLYPAVLMGTLWILSIWHNVEHPETWTPNRLTVNAAVLTFAAVACLGVGNRLHTIRGEIFQLAGPARACSVILALVATGFVIALAISPIFPGDVWLERSAADWALALVTMAGLAGTFAWAAHIFTHRFYHAMATLVVLLVGLYVGIYVGLRLGGYVAG